MNDNRLREILAEELEKAPDLPSNAAEHIAKIRKGALTPGLQAAVNAMRRVADEAVMAERRIADRSADECQL
jgi:vacuolar-type H+-ATPase subunit E/Vma4